MTKSEMKKIMKPLVKECLQEMLLEEGLLSNLISEVNKGNKATFSESSRRDPTPTVFREQAKPQNKPQAKPQINEVRRKLADSIGNGAYANVFEGIEPAPSPSNLGGDDGDPGLDLSVLSNIPGLKGFK
jgi:hypothetical protein